MKRAPTTGTWSQEDVRFLQENWGRSARFLVEHLGRTHDAIRTKARLLKLQKPSQGLLTLRQLSVALGVDDETVSRLIKECGSKPTRIAPVPCGSVKRPGRWKGYELDTVRHYLELRDKETISLGAWGIQQGRHKGYGKRFLADHGFDYTPGSGNVARVPKAVYAELLQGAEGRWCAIWRAVLAIPASDLPCARWFLALLAEDLDKSSTGWASIYTKGDPLLLAWRVLRIRDGKEAVSRSVRAPRMVGRSR